MVHPPEHPGKSSIGVLKLIAHNEHHLRIGHKSWS